MSGIRVKLAVIFILALALRLGAVLNMPPEQKLLKHDDNRYEQIAKAIMRGEGFSKDGKPIAWRGPVYPYFIAGVYKLSSSNPDIIRFIQAIAASFLCLLVFLIAKSAFCAQAGVWAAFLTAVYQPFIHYLYWGGPGYLYTETFYLLLVALSALALIRYSQRQCLGNKILAGAAIAIAALTKPTILAFLPFLGLWLWYVKRGSFLKAAGDFFIIFIVIFAVALPWTIRNYVLFKEFIFISNESGDVFLKGNHPEARGGIVWVDSELEKNSANLEKYSETDIKNAKYKEGLRFLLSNPRRIPYLMFKKFIVNWNFFGEDNRYNFFYGVVLFLGAVGIILSLRAVGAVNLLLFCLLLWPTLLALIFFGEPRYRYPVEPYLIVFAGYALHKLLARGPKEALRKSAFAFLILLNFWFYIFSGRILGFLKAVVP